ncbi:segregation and condensation protein A [Anaerovorax odorimutans]|uniref:segregation and condensation protein A n=1 Tax=Anaerovorax odorimutans TaxID=109327 RepID=UPI000408A133|nr:segregation/condensation protein A [Anaerovorax odorimutans]
MTYKVKLDVFEGPFDLLVFLIEKSEMSIYDIKVSKITSQYLDYIDRMKAMDINVGSEFMVLAATLIEIKSKMLLPKLKTKEEDAIEDPRTELVERILEYKRFKSAAMFLEHKELYNKKIFEKPKEDLSVYTNEPDEFLSLELSQLIKCFNIFLAKKKKVEEIKNYCENVERQKVSLESRIEYINNIFKVRNKHILNFQELLPSDNNKYEVVLTFSAMLEMVRQKTIIASQTSNFGMITLSLKNNLKEDYMEDPSVKLGGSN